MLETLNKKDVAGEYDSCVVKLPKEFALAHNLPEKSFVMLTLQGDRIESEFITYTNEDEREVEEFINDFPGFGEEMKRFGD